MKQILLITLLCVSFNFANAVVLRSNCPDYIANTHTINTHCGHFRVNLELEFEYPEPLLVSYYKVDFKSNLGNIDDIQVSEFTEDIFGTRNYSINIPIPKSIFNQTQFVFYAQIRSGRNIIYQTNEMDPYVGLLVTPDISDCPILKSSDRSLNDKFKVFPNPFIEEFSIKYTNQESEFINIKIFDMNGVLLFSKSQTINGMFLEKINENLPQGVYVCRLTTNNSKVNVKLIKV